MNEVTLYGRLGKDPEVFTGKDDNGKPWMITRLSIATNRTLYGPDGKPLLDENGHKKEETTWHRIKTSGKLADACANNLYSGREVIVCGRINHDDYITQAVDVNTGQPVAWADGAPVMVKMRGTEIIARSVQFIGAKKKQENAYNNQAQPAAAAYAAPVQGQNHQNYQAPNVSPGTAPPAGSLGGTVQNPSVDVFGNKQTFGY